MSSEPRPSARKFNSLYFPKLEKNIDFTFPDYLRPFNLLDFDDFLLYSQN